MGRDGLNPLYRAGVVWNDVGDFSVSANLVSYLTGYSDPRLAQYVKKSKFNDNYLGVRNGMNLVDRTKGVYGKFSKLNVSDSDKLLIISAAESWFIRAEMALKGWNMLLSAKDLYEKGVSVSMKEHNVSDESYFRSDVAPAEYIDPYNSGNNISSPTNISTMFSDNDDLANKERIIVQKWLANFPNGWETWTDRRRVGFPVFFPIVDNRNTDGITSDNVLKRLPYPTVEYNTNKDNVNAAVLLLGGKDNSATALWWAETNNQ